MSNYLIPTPEMNYEPFYGSLQYHMEPDYTHGRYFYIPQEFYEYRINYVTEPYVQPGYVWSGWDNVPRHPNLDYVELSDSVPTWVSKFNGIVTHLDRYNHFIPSSLFQENIPVVKMNLVVDQQVVTKTRFGDMVYPNDTLLQFVGKTVEGEYVWDDFGIVDTDPIELFRVDPFLSPGELVTIGGEQGYMTIHGFRTPDEMVAITPLLYPEFHDSTLVDVIEVF